MNQSITLQIPVKGYVLKYLERHLEFPYKLTLNDDLGVFLYHVLRNQRSDSQYDKIVANYPGCFPVSVSESFLFEEGARHVTSYSSININSFVEKFFKRDLHLHVSVMTNVLGKEKKQSILDYMELYNICDDDISYDGLRMALERINKKKPSMSTLVWRNENQRHKEPSDLLLVKKAG